MRGVAALAVAGAALLLAAAGSPRGIREGGTFKVGVTASFIRAVDPAPAVTYARLNAIEFVSRRTGCLVLNPFLDLSAVCLE